MVTLSEIAAQVDRLMTVTRAGGDTSFARELLLSSIVLLVEQSIDAHDAKVGAIVEEYRQLARKRSEGGRA